MVSDPVCRCHLIAGTKFQWQSHSKARQVSPSFRCFWYSGVRYSNKVCASGIWLTDNWMGLLWIANFFVLFRSQASTKLTSELQPHGYLTSPLFRSCCHFSLKYLIAEHFFTKLIWYSFKKICPEFICDLKLSNVELAIICYPARPWHSKSLFSILSNLTAIRPFK